MRAEKAIRRFSATKEELNESLKYLDETVTLRCVRINTTESY